MATCSTGEIGYIPWRFTGAVIFENDKVFAKHQERIAAFKRNKSIGKLWGKRQ